MEILGQATNPSVIQTHLKKLFAGIHQVKFDEKNEYIVAMKSLEGEVVPLSSKVRISHQVEVSDQAHTVSSLSLSHQSTLYDSFRTGWTSFQKK